MSIDALDVELAIDIIQLTSVLVPLLLGLSRYYTRDSDDLKSISKRDISLYLIGLFIVLFIAYLHATFIIILYGNMFLITAVAAYGSFLLFLFAAICHIFNQRDLAEILATISFVSLLLLIALSAQALL